MKIRRKGFTLLEVVVSAILFALALAGLVNLFLSSGFFTTYNRSRISGGELGRVFLEPLQMSVRQDTWNNPQPTASQWGLIIITQPLMVLLIRAIILSIALFQHLLAAALPHSYGASS